MLIRAMSQLRNTANWHHMAACRELGIEVKTEMFTGTNAEKRARSNSLNCIRRPLMPSLQGHRGSADVTGTSRADDLTSKSCAK